MEFYILLLLLVAEMSCGNEFDDKATLVAVVCSKHQARKMLVMNPYVFLDSLNPSLPRNRDECIRVHRDKLCAVSPEPRECGDAFDKYLGALPRSGGKRQEHINPRGPRGMTSPGESQPPESGGMSPGKRQRRSPQQKSQPIRTGGMTSEESDSYGVTSEERAEALSPPTEGDTSEESGHSGTEEVTSKESAEATLPPPESEGVTSEESAEAALPTEQTEGPTTEESPPTTTEGPTTEESPPPTTEGTTTEESPPPTTEETTTEESPPPTTEGTTTEESPPPTTEGTTTEESSPPTTEGTTTEESPPPTTEGVTSGESEHNETEGVTSGEGGHNETEVETSEESESDGTEGVTSEETEPTGSGEITESPSPPSESPDFVKTFDALGGEVEVAAGIVPPGRMGLNAAYKTTLPVEPFVLGELLVYGIHDVLQLVENLSEMLKHVT